MSLRVVWDTKTHTLSLVAKWVDHFTGTVVPAALDVTLLRNPTDTSGELPVTSPSGPRRQADGTYRFVGVPDGTYTLAVEDATGAWLFFDPAPTVTLPLTDPKVPEVGEAWPSPAATPAQGLTAVRGRLVDDTTGEALAGLEVSIAAAGAPFTKHTWSDDDGEFLFVVTGSIALNSDGELDLEAQIEGGARAVTRLTVGFGGTATTGATFALSPGRASRVVFEVAP